MYRIGADDLGFTAGGSLKYGILNGLNRFYSNVVVGPNNNNSKPYIQYKDGYDAANSPSYSWYYDNGCGIGHPAGSVIAFSTGSAERGRFTNSGLSVTGNVRIASGGDLILSDSGGGNDTFLYNDSQSLIGYINGAERFRVNSSGNFGINNTTPYEKLDVKSASSTSPAIVAGGASANGSFAMAHGYGGANGDYVCTYGSQYSSNALVLGYAVKPSTTANDTFLASADNASFVRGAFVIDDELRFWTAGAQTGTLNNNITMTERFRLTASGVDILIMM